MLNDVIWQGDRARRKLSSLTNTTHNLWWGSYNGQAKEATFKGYKFALQQPIDH